MEKYKYRKIIQIAPLSAIVVGLIVMTGWVFNIELLTTFSHGYPSMKFNTAFCFISISVALLLLLTNVPQRNMYSKILASVVLLIGAITFSEYYFNYSVGIDEFFITDNFSRVSGNSFPGRMGIASTFCFSFMGIAFLILQLPQLLFRVMAQWLLHFVTFYAMLAIIGYMFKLPGVYNLPVLSATTLHTAILFFVLSIATALMNPSVGIIDLFSDNLIGNIMARRLFPTIVLLSLTLTYVRIQIFRHNWIDKELTTVIFTSFFILINLFLIWRTSRQLNKIDVQRKIAEESIVVLNANLEKKVEQRTKVLNETLEKLERTQQEVNEALNKEKELNEMKSRFVSMASHEFKTPLSTILSSASLISSYEDPQHAADREKHVQYIKSSVRGLNDLLEDFLSLGKLEEGRIHVNVAHFNMKDFLETIIDEMKTVLKKGQSIRLDQSNINDFVSDKRLLKNILLNILSNAIKFSPEHSEIIIEANNINDRLRITVKDNGIGIPDEDQKNLFSSFFRGKNTLNIEGTGLGLHIVKRYVHLLKGMITIQSKLANGTTITIDLPYLHQQALA